MSTLSSPLNVDRAILVLCRILRLVVELQHQSSATWSLKFLGMAFRLTKPLDRRTTQKWDVWERSLVSWFLQHRAGDTFCGLTFKIGGRFKRIHSFQHSIFVTKAHDDNASHFAMTKQVMLWYLYSLKIKYGVGTNTSSRLYFIATKGRCNFFPCTIQYFYFHSNSISTSDFIYDIFSLSRLSLV